MARRRVRNFKILDKYSYYTPGGYGIAGLCLWLLVGVLLGNLVSIAFTLALGGEVGSDAAMLVSYPLMFIPAMVYTAVKSSRNEEFDKGYALDNSNFKPVGGAICALTAVLATIALNYIADLFINLLPDMPEWLEEALKAMTQGNFWLNLICVSIFAPIFEEWLCRGMVLRGLLNHRKSDGSTMNPAWAIIISALFFAVIHANPWQAIAAFLLGCLFGFVYWKTGSLKLTMLMHCANNSFALLLSQIPSLKDCDDWSTVFTGPRYWIVFIGCLLIVALTVFKFNKIKCGRRGGCEELPALFDEKD